MEKKYYLVSVHFSKYAVILLIEGWLSGVNVHWLELPEEYGDSWLFACMSLSSKMNWIQNIVSKKITISCENLRSIDDFFIHVGESFFGYKGYAGRDLDGCFEVLKANKLIDVCVQIKEKEQVSKFLENATGNGKYYELFESCLINSGIIVLPEGISA